MSLAGRCFLAAIPAVIVLVAACLIFAHLVKSVGGTTASLRDALGAERTVARAVAAIESGAAFLAGVPAAAAPPPRNGQSAALATATRLSNELESAARQLPSLPNLSAERSLIVEIDRVAAALRRYTAARSTAQRADRPGLNAALLDAQTYEANAAETSQAALIRLERLSGLMEQLVLIASLCILAAFCAGALIIREAVVVPVDAARRHLVGLSLGINARHNVRRDELGECVRAAEALVADRQEAERKRRCAQTVAALLEAREVSRDGIVATLRRQTIFSLQRLLQTVGELRSGVSRQLEEGLAQCASSLVEEHQKRAGARLTAVATAARELGRTARSLTREIGTLGSHAGGDTVSAALPLESIENLSGKARYIALNVRIESARESPSRNTFAALAKEMAAFSADVERIEKIAKDVDETLKARAAADGASLAQLRREISTVARLAEKVANDADPPSERHRDGLASMNGLDAHSSPLRRSQFAAHGTAAVAALSVETGERNGTDAASPQAAWG